MIREWSRLKLKNGSLGTIRPRKVLTFLGVIGHYLARCDGPKMHFIACKCLYAKLASSFYERLS